MPATSATAVHNLNLKQTNMAHDRATLRAIQQKKESPEKTWVPKHAQVMLSALELRGRLWWAYTRAPKASHPRAASGVLPKTSSSDELFAKFRTTPRALPTELKKYEPRKSKSLQSTLHRSDRLVFLNHRVQTPGLHECTQD